MLPRASLASVAVVVAAQFAAAACSPTSDVPLGNDLDAGLASSGGASGGGGAPPVSGSGGLGPDAACGEVHEHADATPLNLYVMFDKSQSMVGDKWDSARAGLEAFLTSPGAKGIRMAIRFFPRDPDATPACDQFAYKTPVVDFGALPGNAAPILAAMMAESPDGFTTPIYPALGGAILEGIEVAENAPGEKAAVLLVTDGQPQGPAPTCGSVDPEDTAAIAELAAVGAAFDPPVPTYVVGLPGVNQAFANEVALAGGSDAAILVTATNVEAEFLDALAKVLGQALSCEYEIPVKVVLGEVAISEVNVELSLAGGDPGIVPYNPTCEDGVGWHYDDFVQPTKILLCPTTCASLKGDLEAEIEILLGCETILK